LGTICITLKGDLLPKVTMAKYVIADDHHMIREAFKKLLVGLSTGAEVLSAKSAKELDVILREHKDLEKVFLDLNLLDTSGLSYLTELVKSYPAEKICIVSGETSRSIIETCKSLGVSGFIPKILDEDELTAAVKVILTDNLYFEDFDVPKASKAFQNADFEPLSKKQMSVLLLMKDGMSNQEIADKLFLNIETVKSHAKNIYTRLSAKSRTDAIKIAKDAGLI